MVSRGTRAKTDAPRRRAAIAAGRGALLLLVLGCSGPPAMEVGPVEYTREEVGLLTEQQRDLLADITAFGLLTAADRLGEVAEPFIEREIRSLILQRQALEAAVADAEVSEEELRAAYARAPQPELVVRHLVVISERWRPEAHRDSARERAQEALERAEAGEPFEELVAEYSDEPGAARRGGLLEPGRSDSWVPEFWAAANDLSPGELSDVVETEFGFHVLRLEERRAIPFEEVREDVLERFVDLPSALSRAQARGLGDAEEIAVDSGAVAAWRTGGAAAGDTLARWEAGVLTADELGMYVATLPQAVRPDREALDPETALTLARSAARTGLLVERARAQGLEPSIAQRAAVEREWAGRLAGIAEALGFSPGMRVRAVKEAALDAMGSQRQGAAIARERLGSLSAVLRKLIPVTAAATPREAPTP